MLISPCSRKEPPIRRRKEMKHVNRLIYLHLQLVESLIYLIILSLS